ncbi:MAG TPA: hemolysin family protein [Mycobacteriales bacterium]|nr:hemolysin family protein [Mycobacteriales bacterium]
MTLGVDVALVLLFLLLGGVFAGTEIALVSLREGQIKALAQRGARGARVAKLASDPNRFLAAVQVGVTLAGFAASAFGAATLADRLAPRLEDLGLSEAAAGVVAFIVLLALVTYLSLVLSELVPKRIALQRAEGWALLFAGPLDRLATVFRPVIWLLSHSTDLVVRLLGGDPSARSEAITEEELRGLVAAHESLTTDERKLIDEVFAAGERQLREVMLPRTEVAFLDSSMTVARAQKVTAEQPHSRYPVARDSQDDVVGFVHVRDLFMPPAQARGRKVGDVAREVKMMPASKKVLPAMSEMRREGHHMAIVVDEYGGTAGIVTLEDLIEEVIGDIRDEYDEAGGDPLRFRGGDIEADGLLNLDEVQEQTGVRLPEGPYETLAGYVMACLGHVPRLGDAVEVDGHRLEVTELDGRRAARVRVTPLEPAGGDPPGPPPTTTPSAAKREERSA